MYQPQKNNTPAPSMSTMADMFLQPTLLYRSDRLPTHNPQLTDQTGSRTTISNYRKDRKTASLRAVGEAIQ